MVGPPGAPSSPGPGLSSSSPGGTDDVILPITITHTHILTSYLPEAQLVDEVSFSLRSSEGKIFILGLKRSFLSRVSSLIINIL